MAAESISILTAHVGACSVSFVGKIQSAEWVNLTKIRQKQVLKQPSRRSKVSHDPKIGPKIGANSVTVS